MISSEQKKGEKLEHIEDNAKVEVHKRHIKLTKGRSQYERVKEKQRK